MKRLLLVLNGKGGVGKSFFAVNLVQYLVDHGITHTAIDTDHENSTLKRYCGTAQFVDREGPRQIAGILSSAGGGIATGAVGCCFPLLGAGWGCSRQGRLADFC